MIFFFGLVGLLVLGIGATLFLTLMRWLLLCGIVILYCIGAVSLAAGAIVFFGLYQFFGAEYGALIMAISITVGLMLAILLFLGIAKELGIRQGNPIKETHHAG